MIPQSQILSWQSEVIGVIVNALTRGLKSVAKGIGDGLRPLEVK